MTQQLTGTTAIVTGASSGIGAATARELADVGATVAVVARRQDRLDALVADIEKAGGSALPVVADISDRAEGSPDTRARPSPSCGRCPPPRPDPLPHTREGRTS